MITPSIDRLGDLPQAASQRFGAREAVLFESQRVSFNELAIGVNDCAKGLLAKGIAAGDRVLIFVPNCIRWLHLFYAVAAIGAVAVPVNTRLRRDDLAYLITQSGASALFISDQIAGVDAPAMVLDLLSASPDTALPTGRFPHL